MQKKLKILTLLFFGLGTLFVTQQYLPRLQKTSNSYLEKTKNIKSEEVRSLTITKQNEKVILVKENEDWRVQDKKADKLKVENLLQALLTNKEPELVSQKDQRHKEFEVTSDSGTTINLDDKVKVILGKSAQGGGFYARLDNDVNIYILAKVTSFNLTTPTEWFDKTIFATEISKIKALKFKKEKDTINISFENDVWVNKKDNSEVNKNTLETILHSLSSFTAEEVIITDSKSYPTNPQLSLKVVYDGATEEFEFYRGKSDYKIVGLSNNEAFVISNYTAEKFTKFTP